MAHRKRKLAVDFEVGCLLSLRLSVADTEARDQGYRRVGKGRGHIAANGQPQLTFTWRRTAGAEIRTRRMTIRMDGVDLDNRLTLPA